MNFIKVKEKTMSDRFHVKQSDVLDALKDLEDNYFDGIFCDPPYGINFMNKKWDHGVPSAEVWKEILRVCKPGAWLLSFGGTRTHHRLMVNIEEAGWELRDCLMYLYGGGFPKNYNISKGIDKIGGKNLSWFVDYILQVADEKGISTKELQMLFPSKNDNPTGWLWNKRYTQGITVKQYNKIKEFLGLPFETINEAEREIIGKKKSGLGSGKTYAFTDKNKEANKEVDVTKPATYEAKQWQGYGLALKPAWEPIILARKPVEKNNVNNCLKWGCGGLNINECRISLNGEPNPSGSAKRVYKSNKYTNQKIYGDNKNTPDNGRFPANLILDEEAAKQLDEQTGTLKSGFMAAGQKYPGGNVYGKPSGASKTDTYADSGGASRFFYTAKVSSKERNAGLEKGENKHPTLKPVSLCKYLAKLILPPNENTNLLVPFSGTGSEIIGSLQAGWNYIYGIELEKEYVNISIKRINYWINDNKQEENKNNKEEVINIFFD